MAQGQIRIIGGEWRGRKLKVPKLPGLRPTPNRIRETLFNWLQFNIKEAYCLDLFAGSGALGFEALSRGARAVVFVDESPIVTHLLQEELNHFKVKNSEIVCIDALHFKGTDEKRRFTIAFLDPPFQSTLLIPACFYLEENAFLAENALIYLESGESLKEKDLPLNWKIIKSKLAGQVAYHLIQRK